MRYLYLSVLLILCNYFNGFSQSSACPANIDFETGTFSNWDCFVGTTSAVGTTNTVTLNPSPPTANRHEIISDPTLMDPYGGFPQLCPYGGQYSVKLGNKDISAKAEGISYTFQIPPSADTFSLTYYYAVVFEDPSHATYEQPRFKVRAYDVLTGNTINCASFNYISTSSLPGFEHSTSDPDVLYKEWTPTSIDFSGLAGRTVRLEFTTADCTLGGHFGYAYLDVATGCGGLLAVGGYCVEANNATLNAPYGFQSYKWFNSNYTTVIGTTRTVTLSPPPPISTLFHVEMIPYPGFGCKDTADAKLTVLPVPDTPVAVTNIYYCQNATSSALSAAGISGNELIWYTSATGGVPAYIAPIPSTAVSGSFEYYVSQKSFFGCEGPRKKITVWVAAIPVVSFTVNAVKQCQIGNDFLFTSTSTSVNSGTQYLWNFGDGSTSTSATAHHTYTNAGPFTVSLEVSNTSACKIQKTKQVDVIPKPLAAFTYPPLICENQTAIVLQNNSSVPGGGSMVASSWWQLGPNVSTVTTPAPFMLNGGNITVKLVAFTPEGCRSDTVTETLIVHFSPVPSFTHGPLFCNNELIHLIDHSTMPAGSGGDQITKWDWEYDNVPSSTVQNPDAIFALGPHTVKLTAESDKGCHLKTATNSFTIYPKPNISLTINDSCVRRNIVFAAAENASMPGISWYWNLGGGLYPGYSVMNKYYSEDKVFDVVVIGQTANGCKDTLIRPFTIYKNKSVAQRDTIVATDEPLQLYSGDITNVNQLIWTPATGLSNPAISDPVALYDHDIYYELHTMTVQGCESNSRIFVKRMNGPELYVPSAFTPNNDGKNDKLRVIAAGYKTLEYFAIYNRRGQRMFYTNDPAEGWDGTYKGLPQEPGNYVWMTSAIDYKDRPLFRKGNVLLLR